MNRRQRREHERKHRHLNQQIHAMLDAAYTDGGKPWAIHGLTDACADCDSVATIRGTPGTGMIWADIRHDEHCPAYRGITPWSFAP